MGIFKRILGGKVKTGTSLNKDYGPESLHDLLIKAKIRGGSSTANLSHSDLAKFEKIISTYAKYIPAGGKFSGHTKYLMKLKGHKLYKKNEITWEDLKDFKKIIDAL